MFEHQIVRVLIPELRHCDDAERVRVLLAGSSRMGLRKTIRTSTGIAMAVNCFAWLGSMVLVDALLSGRASPATVSLVHKACLGLMLVVQAVLVLRELRFHVRTILAEEAAADPPEHGQT